MKKLLLVFCLALIYINVSGQTNDTSFVNFWSSFHRDIVLKDYKSLSLKTKFPLKAKGSLDYDTVDKYQKKDFEKIFSKFLFAEIATYQEIRYDWLKTFELSPTQKSNSKSVRIENMIFEKFNGRWWLTLIYDEHTK